MAGFKHPNVMALIICHMVVLSIGQSSILDRFRPYFAANTSAVNDADQVKFVAGSKVKRFERLTVPLGGVAPGAGNPLVHPLYYGYGYFVPQRLVGAKLIGEGEIAVEGMITFQPLPYSNDIKVTINATGLPPGKHAMHIHTFGDLTEGCKSTGGQFPNNFLGNINVEEDGSISAAFLSVYLTLFGFNGIVGRSFVMHTNPIDLNNALNAEVFSSSLQLVPDSLAYQNEENSVGPPIACGVISVMSNMPALPQK